MYAFTLLINLFISCLNVGKTIKESKKNKQKIPPCVSSEASSSTSKRCAVGCISCMSSSSCPSGRSYEGMRNVNDLCSTSISTVNSTYCLLVRNKVIVLFVHVIVKPYHVKFQNVTTKALGFFLTCRVILYLIIYIFFI